MGVVIWKHVAFSIQEILKVVKGENLQYVCIYEWFFFQKHNERERKLYLSVFFFLISMFVKYEWGNKEKCLYAVIEGCFEIMTMLWIMMSNLVIWIHISLQIWCYNIVIILRFSAYITDYGPGPYPTKLLKYLAYGYYSNKIYHFKVTKKNIVSLFSEYLKESVSLTSTCYFTNKFSIYICVTMSCFWRI